MRNRPIFLAAMVLVVGAGACQPKDRHGAASRPSGAALADPPRPPLRRVEVISQPSAQVAEALLGRKCRVQIRVDALGMAANGPMPLSGRWANESSVDGTVIDMTDQWLVVQATGKRIVIPHASILLIELND